ncbi:unnamed protein product [Brassica oleracea]
MRFHDSKGGGRCGSDIVVRLVAASTCVCGNEAASDAASDAASERRVLRLTPIKPAAATPRALSSPSHTATSSLISISIFDVDLELSHLHLRRRPRALSSLTQHELSLLLRFGFQA